MFNGQSFLFPIDTNFWNGSQCKNSFESLPNIDTVRCDLISSTSTESIYDIYFIKFPTFPYENNIYTNDGNISLSQINCDASLISNPKSISCSLSNLVDNGTFPGF